MTIMLPFWSTLKMGMGWKKIPFAIFPEMELLCGASWVHYQLIPGEKPFNLNCLGISARLTALFN